MKKISIILSLIFCFFTINAWAATETFYICHGGDGSLPETATCATAYDEADFNTAGNWDTDDQDDGKIGPNDDVEVMDEGGTIRAQLTMQQSGLSGKPITIKNYTGDSPVISGADVVSTWTKSIIVELVSDGDVEAATPQLNSLDPTNNNSTDAQSADEAHAGSNSLKLTNSSATFWCAIGWYDGSDHGLVSGETYNISVWVYLPSGQLTDTIYLYTQRNGEGQVLEDSTTTTDTWVQLTGDLVDNDSDRVCRIEAKDNGLGNANGEIIYIDDWSILGPSSTVYEATLATAPVNVYLDGTLAIAESGTCPDDLDTDTEWCHTGGKLYQYTTSDPDTRYTSPGTEATQRDHCISASQKSYITIDGLTLKHAEDIALEISDSDSWTVQNCTIQNFKNHGILSKGDAGNTDRNAGMDFNNNAVSNQDYGSAAISGARGGISCQGCDDPQIYQNTFTSGTTASSAAITIEDTTPAGGGGLESQNGDIYENDISGWETGINIVNADGFHVFRNWIHDGKGMGIGANWGSNDTYIYYNIIHDLNVSTEGNHYNGIDFYEAPTNYVYNNTIEKVYSQCLTIESNSTAVTAKNNILDARNNYSATQRPINITANSTTNLSLSNNDYYGGSGGSDEIGKYGTTICGGDGICERTELSDWNTGTSDSNSIIDDPLFNDASSDEFWLQAGSPGINAGTIPTGYETTFPINPKLSTLSPWSPVAMISDYGSREMGAYGYQNIGGSMTTNTKMTLR